MLTGRARGFRLLPPDDQLGWIPYAWLINVPVFFIHPWAERSVPHGALAVAGAIVLLATYFRAYWVRDRALIPLFLTQAALGVVFTPINSGAYIMFVYAGAFAAQLERTRDAVRWIGGIYAVGLATGLMFDAPTYYLLGHLVFTPFIAGVNLHFARVDRANRHLKLAHEEIQHLAAVAERERIARDLHDVLGHTLSLIVLKAELASKLAERDPARAIQEIRDVEKVSRTALREVRDAIRGYRPTLADEVARARTILDAAHIAADVDVHDVSITGPGEEVIALALREAVTNVVRHSRASRAQIRVWQDDSDTTLEVADDGGGMPAAEGNGLRGMRERVEMLGGQVRSAFGNGMRLTITLPVAGAS